VEVDSRIVRWKSIKKCREGGFDAILYVLHDINPAVGASKSRLSSFSPSAPVHEMILSVRGVDWSNRNNLEGAC
jgi:hypothetical protein